METSVFTEKNIKPNDALLNKALGGAAAWWRGIKTFLEEQYGAVSEEWKYYGLKYGWTLKVILKKRTIFYFVPLNEYFRMSFALNDKAVLAVKESRLPKKMIEELLSKKKYPEGTPLRIEVKKAKDVADAKKIIEIKVSS